MTRKELVEQVVESAGVKLGRQDAGVLLDCMFEVIGKTIRDERRFFWPRFGTFTVRERSARKGRNPRTGAVIAIEAGKTVGFRPTPAFRRRL